MQKQIIENICQKKIIAIVRGIESKYCVKLTEALYKGEINMVEVTFNQKKSNHVDTTEAIRSICEAFGNKVFVGAGTVLTKEQVDMAKQAGACYGVTPSTNPEIIRYMKKQGMVAMPGALSPSEAVIAYEAGADFVKMFPAGVMGSHYIKAVKAPLGHIPMLAVGGINEKNIAEFLKAGAVGAGVGGNLVNEKWLKTGEYHKITALAEIYVKNANSI